MTEPLRPFSSSPPALPPAAPPLPVVGLGYGTFQKADTLVPPYIRFLAHGSWSLPIVLFIIYAGIFAAGDVGAPQTIGGWTVLGSILLGLLMACVALFMNRPYNRRGIFASALVGAILNALAILALGGVVISVRNQSRALLANRQTPILASTTTQRFDNALQREAHWTGTADVHSAKILLRALPDDSPLAMDIAANFPKPFSVALLMVDATNASHSVAVDTAKATAYTIDGNTISALDPNAILRTARSNRLTWVADYNPPIRTAAHVAMNHTVPVFFPSGTDFSRIDRVDLDVDGTTTTVRGKFITAEQLRKTASTTYPGFVGKAAWAGAKILGKSMDLTKLPATDSYKIALRGNLQMFIITIDPTLADESVSVDSSNATATLKGGETVQAVLLDDVLDASKPAAPGISKLAATPLVCQPKSQSPRNLITFFPGDTDFTRVQYVTIHVNGQEILIRGRYMTVAEKNAGTPLPTPAAPKIDVAAPTTTPFKF